MATQPAMRISPTRIRTWVNRLPFFTRIAFLVTICFWLLSLFLAWIPEWGALTPEQLSFAAAYQLNTYPIVHAGLIHTFLGVAALSPLLERFEAEHGTLNTAAMFVGPLSTFPGLLYVLIDHVILRRNHPVLGANSWIFTLLAMEAIKTSRTHPSFNVSALLIPMWTTPLLLALFLSVTLPSFLTPKYIPISLLCNLCACVTGFVFELGYMKILLPPERVVRFIEGKLNLLGRLPHYVSVDQKTYGRYGVLPSLTTSGPDSGGGGFVGLGFGVQPLASSAMGSGGGGGGASSGSGPAAATAAGAGAGAGPGGPLATANASASGSASTVAVDTSSAAMMSNMEDGRVGTSSRYTD